MDGMIYIATGGAATTLYTQTILANNLANVNTVAYKEDKADSLHGKNNSFSSEFDSRVYAGGTKVGTNFNSGSMMTTGRELDLAINGDGMIAVQDKEGKEAYTRNGQFGIDETGRLINASRHVVLGSGGEITIPPNRKIEIGTDGTVSIIPLEGSSDTPMMLDRIKLVKPDLKAIEKGADGLVRAKDGKEIEIDNTVVCVTGYLESSNVNAIQTITQMISIARQFEANLKLLEVAKENDHENTNILAIA